MGVKHGCDGTVWRGREGLASCMAGAKFEHDGKWYCGTHYPPNVADRDRKRREEREDERKAMDESWRRQRIAAMLKDRALIFVSTNHPDIYATWLAEAEAANKP